eukprot:1581559-Pleurochrysis_carterae.AAC.1
MHKFAHVKQELRCVQVGCFPLLVADSCKKSGPGTRLEESDDGRQGVGGQHAAEQQPLDQHECG